jgi:RimJ/RimL family protein N-acetyltransferase
MPLGLGVRARALHQLGPKDILSRELPSRRSDQSPVNGPRQEEAAVTVVLQAPACGRQPALLLRPWCRQDIPDLIDIYRDPVMRRSARNPIVSEQDAHRWLDVQQQGWADGGRLSFAVLDPDPGPANGSASVLGHVVLKEYATGRDSAEIGYWTAPAARNRGVASQAVELLTTWAFDSFGPQGLQRIELLHQQDNLASCRVARKSGYALTRVLPADPPAFPADGHLHTRYRTAP